MIYGARVRQARELRGLTQTGTAQGAGLTQGRIAQIELTSSVDIGDEHLERLAQTLKVPVAFLQRPPVDDLAEGSMQFRARKSLPAGVLRRVRREAEITREIARHMLSQIQAPSLRVPDLRGMDDIEETAQLTRSALGLPPHGPVPRVLHALERAGVIVIALETWVDGKLDAFSTWDGAELDLPLVSIGEGSSWDRIRFTSSHELGHLVMHRAPGGDLNALEKEADQFAGEFLFPREDAKEEFSKTVTLSRLAPLKLKWGMSIASLIFRAFEVGAIDQKQKTSLQVQLGARGWRKQEPGADAREPERPRALRKMMELLYGDPVDTRRLGEDFPLYVTELNRMVGRYADTPSRQIQKPASAPSADASPPGVLMQFRARA
ncbi:helix-turn-helix domain-containing protein [Streptosporangium amethystogenes subsp. fukuiense]|uniref:Helix-turn-helix domain-containing protein n=1 Tax=Streptosporangium amethystogenes subsp. fukuiense TaxID=698418 RepID=A0ABW2T4M1_9ACTN